MTALWWWLEETPGQPLHPLMAALWWWLEEAPGQPLLSLMAALWWCLEEAPGQPLYSLMTAGGGGSVSLTASAGVECLVFSCSRVGDPLPFLAGVDGLFPSLPGGAGSFPLFTDGAGSFPFFTAGAGSFPFFTAGAGPFPFFTTGAGSFPFFTDGAGPFPLLTAGAGLVPFIPGGAGSFTFSVVDLVSLPPRVGGATTVPVDCLAEVLGFVLGTLPVCAGQGGSGREEVNLGKEKFLGTLGREEGGVMGVGDEGVVVGGVCLLDLDAGAWAVC
ncbi:hypothetical protein NDU88_006198 [Pleurodeles waltl]|uniref:Uncharacterized protein n=1 Tax=Pleurodeles waltl TaxID=8319 RepID=A0AAV7QL88_PLEWA|nr:hypothetical protein NDU88_006198 [Pleurodeles waltl]